MDENADGAVVTSVATENATSVTVDNDHFEVADGNLKLKAGRALDFESDTSPIEVVITASGDGEADTHTVSVSVNDVNEAPSAPVVRDAALSVDENDAGATLSSLSDSTDPEGAAVSYSVDNEKFEITSGLVLKLKDGESLNYEDGAAVDLVITASDPDGNSSETPVTVTVGNVNEKPEVMVGALAVNENAEGAAAGTITLSDPEGDELKVKVEVSDERFEVADGMLKLKDGRSLDHETDESIDLTVTVTDADGLTATADATVAVNDVNEKPTLTVGAPSAVGDDAQGAVVTSVSATDPDDGDGANLRYAVSGDERFEVADGMLKLKAGQSLDYEQESDRSIALMVTATDADGLSDSKPVTVTVTNANEAPTIAVADGTTPDGMAASSTVDENAAGALLGEISLSDPDAGQTHMVVVSGAGSERFEATQDAQGGWWLKLKGDESLNYEAENMDDDPTIKLTLTVTDSGTPAMKDTAEVTITVEDVNEAPEVNAEEAKKVSDAPATFVSGKGGEIEVDLKALFSDPDGDGLTYELRADKPDWLNMVETIDRSGDEPIITGIISSTATADEGDMNGSVWIVASDGDGLTAEASFDVVLDKENDAPSNLRLVKEDKDSPGEFEKVTSVEVEENKEAAEIGQLRVDDDDDASHPHGQHMFTFKVDGEDDDRFEAAPSGEHYMLKLKDGQELDFENYEGGEFVLEVTATDKGEEDGRKSDSAEITIKLEDKGDAPAAKKIGDWWVTVDESLDIEDVEAGDWLSFSLDTTPPDAAFEDADDDELTYSVSVADADGVVVNWLQIDGDGNIANKDDTLPKEGVYMVTVTATSEGEEPARATFKLAVALGDFGDTGDTGKDNDAPRFEDTQEFRYTEGSHEDKKTEDLVVVSFSIDDDEVALAPDGKGHPYGVLHVDFEAEQGTKSVKDSLKLVEVGRDGDSVHYEIRAKSAADLAKGADDDGDGDPDVYPTGHDKAGEVKPVKPLDFEKGEEVDITVRVWDNFRYKEVNDKIVRRVADDDGDFVLALAAGNAADTHEFTFDIVDADDAKPEFDEDKIHGADAKRAETTTTITVGQEGAEDRVIVVPLEDAWSDDGTASDELVFDWGEEDLPGWIKVYGPRGWESIFTRVRGVDEDDGPSNLRDSEKAFVIVIDRTADGDNVGTDDFSFTLTATDDEGNKATETIKIDVTDTNVAIPDDAEDVVKIVNKDEANGLGSLTMRFNQELDPDFAGGAEPALVLYTWKLAARAADDTATSPRDESEEFILSVSTTPEPLRLDARNADLQLGRSDSRPDGVNDFIGDKIVAQVEYYEMDPVTKQIVLVKSVESDATPPVNLLMDETAVVKAADADDKEVSVMFDFETVATGLQVTAVISNEDSAPTSATFTLEKSKTGADGSWGSAGAATAAASVLTTDGVTTATLNPLVVDQDLDGTGGDGEGFYYRVVLNYGSGSDAAEHESPAVGKLGQLADPDPNNAFIDIQGVSAVDNGGEPVPAGTTGLRINVQDNVVDVQWQFDPPGPKSWEPIKGAGNVPTLRVDDVHAGGMVRAKVTYKTKEDDPTTTDLDEEGLVEWIEYTEIISVEAGPENNAPVANRTSYEVLVEPKAKQPMKDQPGTVHTFSVEDLDLFYDSDNDDLSYTITSVLVDRDSDGTADPADDLNNDDAHSVTGGDGTGYRAETLEGNQVHLIYTTTIASNVESAIGADGTEPQQTLAIDDDGNVTYITNEGEEHDGDWSRANDGDGLGNALVVTIRASDADSVPAPDQAADATVAEIPVTIRINVAPTAIELRSVETDGSTVIGAFAALPKMVTKTNKGTALVVQDGVNTPDDTDSNPDTLTFMDDVEQAARKVADIDVQDLNLSSSDLGTHVVTLSGRGRDQFVVVNSADDAADRADGSTWDIRLKDDATFDFDELKLESETGNSITLSITVTAKDKGDPTLMTTGVFSVVVMNDTSDDDDDDDGMGDDGDKTPPKESDPTVEGLEDDEPENNDNDVHSEDGPAIPPPDGGAFLDDDDLLGDFVLAIDDGIDIA